MKSYQILNILAVVVCLLLSQMTAEATEEEDRKAMQEQMQKDQEECMAQAGVTNEDYKQLRDAPLTVNITKINCVEMCMMEKIGDMKDGVIQKSPLLDHLKQRGMSEAALQNAEKVMDYCISTTQTMTNRCEVAAQYEMCLRDYQRRAHEAAHAQAAQGAAPPA